MPLCLSSSEARFVFKQRNMSGRGRTSALLCQGFLKKRKDKMKLRWKTYWFRLHNTTLFFYTKKRGNALDLRGQYYIHDVQSVLEVNKSENKRFLFEITMKNGKKKVLAAETAEERQEWIEQLWKAMMLLSSSRDGSVVKQASQSSFHQDSNTERISAVPDTRCLSADGGDVDDLKMLCTNATTEQNTSESLLTDYDILPRRNTVSEEPLYDTPSCKWRVKKEDHGGTDGVYDVPNNLVRKIDQSGEGSEQERSECGSLLTDMLACLEGESAAWVQTVGSADQN